MNKQYESLFESKLRNSLSTVSRVIADELGIVTEFDVVKNEWMHAKGQVFFSLVEAEGKAETDKAFRVNAALRQLFKEVRMVIKCGYDPERDAGHFMVDVDYDHEFGRGHNGHELMTFWIKFETGDVEYISK